MAVTELGQTQGLAWQRSAGSTFAGSPIAELQEWLGGAPEPVTYELQVSGGIAEPYVTFVETQTVSWSGVNCTLVGSDGSSETIDVRTDPRVSLQPAEGYEIPADSQTITLQITITLESGESATWRSERAVNPDSLATIEISPCDPEWSPEGTITELQLPTVNARMASGTKKGLSTAQLIALLAPSTVSVEVAYQGAEDEIVQLNGSTAVINGRKDGAPCNIYRYRVDNDVKSGWQTITPPPAPEPPTVTYHLEVTGDDPYIRLTENQELYWVAPFTCKLVGSDGSEETIDLQTDPRVTLSPPEGARIPAGTKTITFQITVTLEGGEQVTWRGMEHPVDPDRIMEIEAEPCDPEWSPEGTITELQLPPATAHMRGSGMKPDLTTAQLIELAAPSTVAVEVHYRGAEPETVQLNGSTAVIHGMKGEAPCVMYSYSVDGKRGYPADLTPPPAAPEPDPEPDPEPEVPAA